MIHTITVIDEKTRRSRTWGYYFKFEDAEEVVLKNLTDIYECGYYDLAVIEQFPEGVLTLAEPENNKWYRAEWKPEEKIHVVTPIECPEQFKRSCNWGMG